jgi:hypothetical protein
LLLLEPSFRPLARAPLLLELLLRCDKRGNPVRQVGPQLLGLHGLLLSLALPGLRSLEGCAVLLELGLSRGKLRFPRPASRPGPRAPSAAPRPAPEAPTSPSQLQRRLTQPRRPSSGARPAQFAVGTPAIHCRSARPLQGCRGRRTAPGTSRARSSAERGGCTAPEPGPPAHVASRRDAGGRKVRNTRMQKGQGSKSQIWQKNAYLKDPPRRPPVDSQRLIQHIVDRPGPRQDEPVAHRHNPAPALGARRRRQAREGQRVTTRPRRRAPGAAASHSHPLASPTPPPQARGLVRARSPIGPTRGWGVVVRNVHHGRTIARGDGKRWRC